MAPPTSELLCSVLITEWPLAATGPRIVGPVSEYCGNRRGVAHGVQCSFTSCACPCRGKPVCEGFV
eukprot:7440240-Alexandrium_andersonii.AAC.1